MPIDCYECRGLGDDYRIEDGELVSNCDGCINNEDLPDCGDGWALVKEEVSGDV